MGSPKVSPEVFNGDVHGHREDLVGEHPHGDTGQVVAFVVFFAIWGMDSFLFTFSTALSTHVPMIVRLVPAALCFIPGGWMALSGHRIVFKEVRDPPRVIDRGVFGMVRHPLYLSALLFYLGVFFTTLSLLSLAVLLVIFLFYDRIASYEEKLLGEKFGKEYGDYRRKVNKWFPLKIR